MIAAGAHGAVAARAAVHDDALNAGAAVGQRLVHRALQFDGMAAAPAAVGGDHELGARILDAVLDGVGGKAAENHRMHGADAGTGLHGDHRLRNQRHVNDDAVAAADAGGLERVGETAHLAVQLGIGQLAHIAGLALEHDGDLPAPLAQIHIQAIVRDIQPPVGEPAVVGRVVRVQSHGKRLLPIDFGARQIGPETDIVALGLGVHRLQFARLERGILAKLRRRRKYTVFLQHGLNVFFGHGPPPAALN